MSFRARLALWYGGTAGTLVALACVYSYVLHSRTHYDDLDMMLESMSEHVAGELVAASTPEERERILRASDRMRTRAWVYAATGELRQSSPAAATPLLDPQSILAGDSPQAYGRVAALGRGPNRHASASGAFGLAQGPAGEGRWRIYVQPLRGSAEYLAMGVPLGRLDASIDTFRRLMALMAVAGSGGAFLVGWILAGRAMRPVGVLTDTAAAIASSREFSRRVPGEQGRDELGRLASTFNDMLTSLEQVYAGQQRFLADASHELRAPLTLIQANLELARRPEIPQADQATAIDKAYAETSRLSRLVGDLLALARADAGMPIRRERVELDRLLLEVLGETRRLAPSHRLAVDELEPSTVSGDGDRLRQLMRILLDNALKYTPPRGRIAVGLACDGATAIISVRDSGVGIPPEHLPHVFERFYRGDPGRARDPGGTGLGLPIGRWIVEQHGGSIELASRPGEGTEARVRLPLGRASSRGAQSRFSGRSGENITWEEDAERTPTTGAAHDPADQDPTPGVKR